VQLRLPDSQLWVSKYLLNSLVAFNLQMTKQNAIQQAAPSEAPKILESNPTSKTIFFQDEVKVYFQKLPFSFNSSSYNLI